MKIKEEDPMLEEVYRNAAENIRTLRERSETLHGWHSRHSASRNRGRLVFSRLLPGSHRKRLVPTRILNRFDNQNKTRKQGETKMSITNIFRGALENAGVYLV